MKHSAPTMKDVAREAGVSLGTVSKVINGIPVGEDYRARVEAAIASLNYQINSYARALKTNRTGCVAVVMPSLRHPFFAQMTDALTACLMRRGYRSMLMITNYDPEAEQKSFDLVQQNKVDGVIALTYSPDLVVDDALPLVTIDRHLGEKAPCVSSDNFEGGKLAARTLMALGCRKLLSLRVGPPVLGEPDRRGPGFAAACREANADFEQLAFNIADGESEAPVYAFLQEKLGEAGFAYDGVFCNSDWLARRVADYLLYRGVNIPGDVQLIGFDGMIDYVTDKYLCSTIVQPLADMAEAAVELLLEKQANPPRDLRLPVTYAPGGTTGG